MNLAEQVALLESSRETLLAETETLRKRIAVLECERDQLASRLRSCEVQRDEYLKRASAVKAVMDRTASNLVAGMNEVHGIEVAEAQTKLEAPGHDFQFVEQQANGEDKSTL